MRRVAPFNPTQISGCQLWLDGSDSTTITTVTGVSQWNDKSVNGYNLTQSTGGSQPTRSGNLLNFVSNYNMNIPQAAINNAATWSIFFMVNPIASVNWFMAKQHDGTNSFNIFSTTQTGGPSPNAYFTGATNYLYVRMYNAGTLGASSAALTMSQLQLLSFVYDGTSLYIYINGNLSSTTTGGFAVQNDTSCTNFLLGEWYGNGTNYNSSGNFQLGELNYWNTGLTTPQQQQVEGYLAQKWGLRSNLPSGHLGLTSVIYPTTKPLFLTPMAYPVLFSPTTIASLAIWLDASDQSTVTGTSSVTAWSDKSGLGNTMNGTSGHYPALTAGAQNGLSVMTFSGSQVFTGPITLGGTSFTEFVVYYNTSVTVGQAFIDDNTGPVGILAVQNGGGNQFQTGFAYGSTFQTGGAYRIFATNCTSPTSSSTVSVWFNGTNQNISGWNFYGHTPVAITSLTIGARKDLIYFTGKIAEIIIYNTAITAGQQQQIEGYLAWKWGLQANLPAGHTYKSAAPGGGLTNPLGVSRMALPSALYPIPITNAYSTPR